MLGQLLQRLQLACGATLREAGSRNVSRLLREPVETCLFTTHQVEISRKCDFSRSAHLKSSCNGSAQMHRCYLIHQSRKTEGGVDKPRLPSLSSQQRVRMVHLPVAGYILLLKQMLHLNFHFKEFGFCVELVGH